MLFKVIAALCSEGCTVSHRLFSSRVDCSRVRSNTWWKQAPALGHRAVPSWQAPSDGQEIGIQ